MKLAAPSRIDALQDHINNIEFHTLAEINDHVDLDYHCAKSLSSLIKAKGLIDSLILSVVNDIMVQDEDSDEL
jgi:hypothetical protein